MLRGLGPSLRRRCPVPGISTRTGQAERSSNSIRGMLATIPRLCLALCFLIHARCKHKLHVVESLCSACSRVLWRMLVKSLLQMFANAALESDKSRSHKRPRRRKHLVCEAPALEKSSEARVFSREAFAPDTVPLLLLARRQPLLLRSPSDCSTLHPEGQVVGAWRFREAEVSGHFGVEFVMEMCWPHTQQP